MAQQALPINQINALPVATIGGVVGGAFSLIGGKVTRYFSPADLGINGATVTTIPVGAGFYYFLPPTPYLDLRGCSLFSLVLTRNVQSAGAYIQGSFVQVQIRMGAADAPAVTYVLPGGVGVDDTLASKVVVHPGQTLLWTAGNNGDLQRVMISWGGIIQAGLSPGLIGGTDSRIIIDWSTNNPGHAGDTFTASMWAQG